MRLEHDLKFIKWNPYTTFQLNMSKNVGAKSRKLCIFSCLNSKMVITSIRIDGNWRRSNLICRTLKHSNMPNFSSIFPVFYVPKGAYYLYKLTNIDDTLSWSVVHWNKVLCKISAFTLDVNMSKHVGEKCGKLYFKFSKFQLKLLQNLTL